MSKWAPVRCGAHGGRRVRLVRRGGDIAAVVSGVGRKRRPTVGQGGRLGVLIRGNVALSM